MAQVVCKSISEGVLVYLYLLLFSKYWKLVVLNFGLVLLIAYCCTYVYQVD